MESTGTRQWELAKAIGMRPQTVSLYVQGQSFPDVNGLAKIADYFHVSADYLLGRTDIKTPDVDRRAMCEHTGLCDSALSWLSNAKTTQSALLEIFNALFDEDSLIDLLLDSMYLYTHSHWIRITAKNCQRQ